MTTVEGLGADSDPPSPPGRTEVAPRARHKRQRLVRWDRFGRIPEVFVTSDPLARALTGVIATVVVTGTVFWGLESWRRFQVPEIIRPWWFRGPQFAIALAGIAAAVVETAYLVYFAIAGLIWRRWRGITLSFGVLSGGWTAIWILDRFVLDSVFIP